jgi:hypothetical protein
VGISGTSSAARNSSVPAFGDLRHIFLH